MSIISELPDPGGTPPEDKRTRGEAAGLSKLFPPPPLSPSSTRGMGDGEDSWVPDFPEVT